MTKLLTPLLNGFWGFIGKFLRSKHPLHVPHKHQQPIIPIKNTIVVIMHNTLTQIMMLSWKLQCMIMRTMPWEGSVRTKTLKSIQNKTSKAPLIPRQAEPERYRTPTSKSGQENQPTMTSKGALQHTVHTITKNKNITINSVHDQEPIARRTRSSRSTEQLQPTQPIQNKSEPIANRTISRTFAQKYTTPSHSRDLATQLLTHVANSLL